MTLSKTIQYQLMQLWKPFAWYFGLILLWNVFFNFVISWISGATVSSFTSFTFFFVALLSYLGFGVRLKILLQNGVSRNTMFWSACTVVIILIVTSILCNVVFELANTGKLGTSSVFSVFYGKNDPLFDALWWSCVYVFLASVASLIGVLMVKLAMPLRIVVWMVVPVLLTLCVVFENVRKVVGYGVKYVLGLHNVDVISLDGFSTVIEALFGGTSSLGGEVSVSIAMFLGLSVLLWVAVYALMRRIVVVEQ